MLYSVPLKHQKFIEEEAFAGSVLSDEADETNRKIVTADDIESPLVKGDGSAIVGELDELDGFSQRGVRILLIGVENDSLGF